MKTEMKMMPNGNYERVISPIQHKCRSKDNLQSCTEYGWELGVLRFEVEEGDPYDDGFSWKTEFKFCPFCGYQPERLNPETKKEKEIILHEYCLVSDGNGWGISINDDVNGWLPNDGDRIELYGKDSETYQYEVLPKDIIQWERFPYHLRCDSLNSVVTQREESEEVLPPRNRS